MSGRIVVFLLVLGLGYLWQHQYELRRWWRLQSNEPLAAAAGVSVYTARACGPCADAITLLQRAGQTVAVRDVDADPQARAEFENAGGGMMPLIVDGMREMRGFNPELLSSWYVERARTAQKLDQLGVYRPGEARMPLLYGTTWCPYCAQAREYFAKNGMAFRDLDIEHDAEARRQYDALGLSGVPVLVYEDMIWNGFSVQGMDERRKWVGNGRW